MGIVIKEHEVESTECIEMAHKIAKMAIHSAHEEINDSNFVDSEVMHKVKNAVKTLYYIHNMK
ncbi:TPA: hypothetical protein R8I27_001646 [Campylobacter jejuni]|nr:hypothetical protein [Campylobacter jejuni]HEG8200794.1 hypothetical protein [Campylobacter jejuni]